MSASSQYSSIRPSLLLDFANTEQLDPRITFARSTTATYYDDNTVAKAEENLVQYSQQFTNAFWGQSSVYGISNTANTTQAPDGTTTASTTTALASTTIHLLQAANIIPWNANNTFTQSIYIKAGTWNYYSINVYTSGSSNWATAVVDLSTGAITKTGSSGNCTYISSSCTSVGSGWYRLVLTYSTTATGGVPCLVFNSSNNPTFGGYGQESWTAAGTETVYLWGAQLEQRSTVTAYTATTSAPITNYIPVLMTAAINEARLDHNPTTRESLGLLIEESRTNLLPYSDQFDNAVWDKTNVTVTANTIVAPDGTLTADLLIPTTTAGTHKIGFQYAPPSSTWTFSVYVKSAGVGYVALNEAAQSGSSSQQLNLSTGVLTGVVGSTGTTTVISVGNGWYRLSWSHFVNTATNAFRIVPMNAAGNPNSYSWSGDDYSGIYIWGAQFEIGSFSTSYIPTVLSQVTRSADSASMTGSNFSSWYNQAEGTLYAEYSGSGTGVAAFSPVAVGSYACMGTGGNSYTGWYASGLSNLGTISSGYNKQAAQYAPNKYFAASLNGGSIVSSSSSDYTGTSTSMIIGVRNNNYLNGTIKRIAYYPARLTNAQLQAITS